VHDETAKILDYTHAGANSRRSGFATPTIKSHLLRHQICDQVLPYPVDVNLDLEAVDVDQT
jgi:hypothetical protein